mgnify:FL=1
MKDAITERGLYLNAFADGVDPIDMTKTGEFASLLESACDLSIPHSPDIQYRSSNVVVRHQRFHYLEWGAPDAQPILLLHGGHQSAHSWDLVSLHLAQKYRIIALDQRGHGDSEWARNGDYSNLTMAQDAQAFVAAIGLQNPIIMGHSMGGRNTLLMTRTNPDYPVALVIVDVGPETIEAGRKTISNFVKRNEIFDDLEHFIRNVREYDPYRSREHIERTVKYNMLERADGKYISKCDYRRWRGEIEVHDENRDAISLDDLASFEMPALIVRGANSNILADDAAERFRDALPKGNLVTVPNCGHNVHSQNTLGFIDAVGKFLSTLK